MPFISRLQHFMKIDLKQSINGMHLFLFRLYQNFLALTKYVACSVCTGGAPTPEPTIIWSLYGTCTTVKWLLYMMYHHTTVALALFRLLNLRQSRLSYVKHVVGSMLMSPTRPSLTIKLLLFVFEHIFFVKLKLENQ